MNYSAELFQAHLHSRFTIELSPQTHLELVLDKIQVRPVDHSPYHQFSLFFTCTGELQLQQGSFSLQHAELPNLDLFLVPISNSAQTYTYQASFTVAKK